MIARVCGTSEERMSKSAGAACGGGSVEVDGVEVGVAVAAAVDDDDDDDEDDDEKDGASVVCVRHPEKRQRERCRTAMDGDDDRALQPQRSARAVGASRGTEQGHRGRRTRSRE